MFVPKQSPVTVGSIMTLVGVEIPTPSCETVPICTESGALPATDAEFPMPGAISVSSGDGTAASSSHGESIGLSTSSWQPEGELLGNDGVPKNLGQSSIESKASLDWSEEKENTVRRPYDYIISLKGKAFRRQVLFALNVWLQVDAETCEIIDHVVSMLHNSSLLIDDIQDESKQRRGSLSAHEVFGVAQTINSANYMYFEAQQQLQKLENWPQAFLIFNEELLNLHRGQGMELYWRDTLQPPSEADYLQMVANKTGGLFRLLLRLLQGASKCEYDIRPLVEVLGLMFQILDDYKNLKDVQMSKQKGYCEDLTEGKFSFPVSHAIWTDDTRKGEILRILKSKTTDDTVKTYVVECLEKSGSLEYTRVALEGLYERARILLAEIPQPNPAIEALFHKLIVCTRSIV